VHVPPPVPEALVRATTQLRGEAGARWLEGLPALVADLERRWSLEAGPPFPGASVSWVAPASLSGGTPAVLKLSFPGDKELGNQIRALELFGGRGAVRLLAADPGAGALLLERCKPGAPLSGVEDDERATCIAAGVMEELWRPVPPEHPFPPVADWAEGFARLRRRYRGGTGPLSGALVGRAEALFKELIPSQAETFLLHGDLHHGNVLSAGRRPWLAIDPKGFVGERAADTATLLHNPAGFLAREPNPGRLLRRRIDLLSERLGLDRARVRGWGLAQAVAAAYWGLEDYGRVWEEALAFAELLRATEL
jgi:streptomycin 6-kinase